ncbi:hypothetical protein BDV93DRAFT_604474 [Ceratobasidium sp. AG-I]|nr:hypothetical protein BDV93DRAFT_604474 [Ceratobasidium sp. AG-I]
MIARTIRPAFKASQRVAVARTSAMRHFNSAQVNTDADVIEREKQKNLQGRQHSPHKHAPGWNEALATDAEATIKANQANVTPEEMTRGTVEHLRKQHPDSLADQVRDHINAPSSLKDVVEGPLGALGRAAKKAVDGLKEVAAGSVDEVQGPLSGKGAKAEEARKNAKLTSSEDAVKADRGDH